MLWESKNARPWTVSVPKIPVRFRLHRRQQRARFEPIWDATNPLEAKSSPGTYGCFLRVRIMEMCAYYGSKQTQGGSSVCVSLSFCLTCRTTWVSSGSRTSKGQESVTERNLGVEGFPKKGIKLSRHLADQRRGQQHLPERWEKAN